MIVYLPILTLKCPKEAVPSHGPDVIFAYSVRLCLLDRHAGAGSVLLPRRADDRNVAGRLAANICPGPFRAALHYPGRCHTDRLSSR